MRRVIFSVLIFGLMAAGCHVAKQVQRNTNDTAAMQPKKEILKPVDSAEIIKTRLSNVINTPLNYTTFYGRAKANFNSPQASGNVTLYIKMKKDSVIWISVTALLNIEVARILVTPDSVKIINKLENSVQLSSIANLQKITKLPLDFKDFQNIILGKPVLNNTVAPSYQIKQDSVIITATSEMLKYIYSFAKSNFQLVQSNVSTMNNNNATGANIFYNDYHTVNDINFSASRDVAVTGSSPMSLQLNFKEYNFNQPQDFMFTISKNYRVKYD